MGSAGSLNHVYRTVWNQALGAMVAVAELAPTRAKSGSPSAARAGLAAAPMRLHLGLSCLALALAWGVAPSAVHANPSGGLAIQGQASFSNNASQLLVTTQNGAGLNHAAINWQSFSIPAGSSTYFQQPNAASTVINRVVTSTPSLLFGTLGSNGHLVLVNQSGITVGAGAVIDTAGFTASALRMGDADALSGRLRFGDGTSAAGAVSVLGTVLARSGDVVLLGAAVDTGSTALVQAANGSTLLAAGQQIEITGRGLEGIVMQVQAPGDSAINLGNLQGDAVGIFAGTLKHSGLIQASTATLEGGKVVLRASAEALVQGQSQTLASSTAGKGGQIAVLGQRVAVMDSALLDASGATGGGTVLVGGDYQGQNAAVQNAAVSYLGPQARIAADATLQGDGGRVIVWADDTTRAFGSISAQGGAAGGDGGLVETSGRVYLDVAGARVSTLAPQGKTGNWLLDPTDITITAAAPTALFTGGIFDNGGGATATLSDRDINAQLYGTDITIQTTSAGSGAGDIRLDSSAAALSLNNSSTFGLGTLTLVADRDIVFAGANGTTVSGSAFPLRLVLQPGARVLTEAGALLTLDGYQGAVQLKLADGKTWDNLGTLHINGDASVQLGQGAAFRNATSGVTDVASSSLQAFASTFANPSLNDGKVFNDGTMNVRQNTAFGAEYHQTGALHISNATLSLPNARELSGSIDLSPSGTDIEGKLRITGSSGSAYLHDLSMLLSSSASPAVGDHVTIGDGTSTVAAKFTRVSAPLLRLGGAVGSALTIADGYAHFQGINASGSLLIRNGALGIGAGDLSVDANNPFQFEGNVALYVADNLRVDKAIATTGSVSLISGWNGSVTAPASLELRSSGVLTLAQALSAKDVKFDAYGGIVLDAGITASGTLDLRSSAAGIGPSVAGVTAPVQASGATTLKAQTQVDLSDAGNRFSSLEVDAGGAVYIVAQGDVGLGNIKGSSVSLETTGAIAQSAGASITTTGNSYLNAGNGGAVTLIGRSLSLGTVQADGVTYCTEVGCGDGGAGGDVLLHATSGAFSGTVSSKGGDGDSTYGGNGGSGGAIDLVVQGGVVSLSSGSFQVAGGVGGGIQLIGSNGAAGRWRVFADNPASVAKGGLTSDYRYYGASYDDYRQLEISQSGNGFVYASAAGILQVNALLASGLASNTYGDASTAVFGYSLSGFADLEDTAANIGLAGPAVFDLSFQASTAAGSYLQKYASGLSSALGYSFAVGTGLTYTVNQRPITVSTSAVSKTYDGGTAATGAAIVTGGNLVGNDAVSGGVFAFADRNAGAGNKTVGVSGITVSDGNGGANYLVSYASNTASTITPAAVTLTAPVVSKTYDGSTSYAASAADLATLSAALLAGDTVNAATLTYADRNVGAANKAVTVGSAALDDGNGGLNYTLSFAGNSASTITAAAVTLTAPVVSKTYDGSTSYAASAADLATLSAALLAGDTVNAATLTYADRNVGAANKAVTVGSAALNDGNGGLNYTLSFVGNTASTITPAAVTLTAPVVSKTYDGSTSYAASAADLATLSAALLAGDKVNAATLTYADRNAGAANKAVTVGSAALDDGNGGRNYTLSFVGNTASTITPAAVTLTAPVVSKTYDGRTEYAASLTDLATLSAALLAGDKVNAATLTYADRNVGAANKAVTVGSAALNDGNGGLNYTLSFAGNTASTITPAPLATWTSSSSGLWSTPGNWTALPDGQNVLAVSIPADVVVTFDDSVAATSLQSLNSDGKLSVTGSSLSVANALNTLSYSQSGGALTGAGTFTARNSFSQSAGSIAMGGAVSIRQASGNLSVGRISGSGISLEAALGAIDQSAALATPGLLKLRAANGAVLTQVDNAVSAFAANSTGPGDVLLTNRGPLDVQGVAVANGRLAIDNTGALRTSGAISVAGGGVKITTHSPLVIDNTVTAEGSIQLAALTPDSSSNITLNGSLRSTAGGISIQAYNNFIQNAGLSAALAIEVSAGGSLSFGAGALSVGNPVSYTANGLPYVPPWIASTVSGGANTFVATFLDQFEAALDAQQLLALDDPLGLKQRSNLGLVVEGEICIP